MPLIRRQAPAGRARCSSHGQCAAQRPPAGLASVGNRSPSAVRQCPHSIMTSAKTASSSSPSIVDDLDHADLGQQSPQ